MHLVDWSRIGSRWIAEDPAGMWAATLMPTEDGRWNWSIEAENGRKAGGQGFSEDDAKELVEMTLRCILRHPQH